MPHLTSSFFYDLILSFPVSLQPTLIFIYIHSQIQYIAMARHAAPLSNPAFTADFFILYSTFVAILLTQKSWCELFLSACVLIFCNSFWRGKIKQNTESDILLFRTCKKQKVKFGKKTACFCCKSASLLWKGKGSTGQLNHTKESFFFLNLFLLSCLLNIKKKLHSFFEKCVSVSLSPLPTSGTRKSLSAVQETFVRTDVPHEGV